MSQVTARKAASTSSPPRSTGSLTEERLRQLLKADPDRCDAWYQLGLIEVRRGHHTEAIECLATAVALDSNQASFHHHLAASYQALGQRDHAVHHYHRVVCLQPDLAEAHNNYGIALAQLGQRDEAIAAFSRALQLKPDFHEAHNNWGIALVEQGHLDQAVVFFRQSLSLQPNYPEAHNNLGMALRRQGNHEEALVSFAEAVRLAPDYLEAHQNLGNQHRDLGRLDEALTCYRRVVQLRPDHRDARQQIALTLARQGCRDEAIAGLHQCLLFQPDVPETYNTLGVLLCQCDRLDDGAAAFSNAVRLRPTYAEAHNNLGNVLLRQQKTDAAIACFQQALELRQDQPQPHCNLGSALLGQGKAEEAISHYQEALRLQPDYVEALFNLGNAYRTQKQLDEAVGCYEKALQLQPDNTGARLNLGVALSEQGHLDRAVETMTEVLRRQPDFAHAHNSLGVARMHQGLVEKAISHFDQGLQHQPDDADMHLNRALAWLLLGDFKKGWPEYEWRWKLKKVSPPAYAQPAWDGSPLPWGTIVLWAEQGLGDTIQFARYIALTKERVGTVLLDCPGPLQGLLASCPGVDRLVGAGAPLPPIDVQAPLMSLPRILGTTPSTIPASVPYLLANAALRERWRTQVGSGKGLKVGILWQGNPQFAGDRYRSVPLEQFRHLAQVPGVRLFSLQKGKGAEQLPALAEELGITDLGSLIAGDFQDTAAAILNLDLVISVDTSVAHLAGALNVPVWILLPFNPDWRWLLGRDDSAWYPSARLFRQQRWGDWDDVFARVTQALHRQASRPILRHFSVRLGIAELVERAVRDKLTQGPTGAAWGELQQTGLLEIPEVAKFLTGLETAHAHIEQVAGEMQTLASSPQLQTLAPALVQRSLQAQQERREVLTRFSAWLMAGQSQQQPEQPTGQ